MPHKVIPKRKPPLDLEGFLFSTHGRVSRLPYGLFVPLTYAVLMVAVFAYRDIDVPYRYQFLADSMNVVTIAALLSLTWPHFVVISKRLQDAGLPKWPAWLSLVPMAARVAYTIWRLPSFYGLPTEAAMQAANQALEMLNTLKVLNLIAMCLLVFIPGTKGVNRYGPSPLDA